MLSDIDKDLFKLINDIAFNPEKNLKEHLETLTNARSEITEDFERLVREYEEEKKVNENSAKIEICMSENEILNREIEILKRKNEMLERKNEERERICHLQKTAIEYVKSELHYSYMEKSTIISRLKEIFTTGQVNKILNPAKRATWSQKDVASAISIYELRVPKHMSIYGK